MRKDHFSLPVKWTREFRRALKLGDVHFKTYCYLESAPESHATGIYFVTVAAIAAMVIEDQDVVGAALDDLQRVGLILWDAEADVVYVHAVCAEQFRWRSDGKPKEADKRVLEARNHLRNLPDTPLLATFLNRWPVFAEGASEGASEGAYQGAWQGTTTYTNTTTTAGSPQNGSEHESTAGGRP